MTSVPRDRVCTDIHRPQGRDQDRDTLVQKLVPGKIRLRGADKVSVAA